jgi:hypothetical protein
MQVLLHAMSQLKGTLKFVPDFVFWVESIIQLKPALHMVKTP